MDATLKAEDRAVTTRAHLREIRKNEGLPGVLYGKDRKSAPVSVDANEFFKVYRQVGKNGVISLDFADQGKYPVMVHELQYDSIKGTLVHVDFFSVDLNKEVDADVPVQIVGEAAGVKEGGVLQHMLHDITVRAKPNDFPDSISVNVEKLEIGDTLQVGDLEKSGKYEIQADDEEPIVSVVPPSKEPEETEEEEDTGEAAGVVSGQVEDNEDKEDSGQEENTEE
ncbi:50S ribosomal protein L25/general stress protein Ctc [Pseudalkalibacillus caeni]|uniref:Large ribosomal subunit protein bL25 n=1 Tax=Exobacillus caeni TaxID=2574798 RepID=A0A5R9EV63_9BACL|nr:50S ribosomal protein L25/general stress protein Ctc [Pseudalkalibacillus caeni]TLS35112.1 50S ribosomal protein L25/general stress protein Ctc [Pseudalkalibacillus caeni]